MRFFRKVFGGYSSRSTPSTRQILAPFRKPPPSNDAWIALVSFWQDDATEVERREISHFIQSKYRDVGINQTFWADLQDNQPDYFVEFRLVLNAIYDRYGKHPDTMHYYHEPLSYARKHDIDAIPIIQKLIPLCYPGKNGAGETYRYYLKRLQANKTS